LREYLNDIIVRSDPSSPNELQPKAKKGAHRSFLGHIPKKNKSKKTSIIKAQMKDELDEFLEGSEDSDSGSLSRGYMQNSKSALELRNQRVAANFAA